VGLAQSFLRIVLRRQLQNEKKIKDETKYLGISILFGGHFSINKYIFYNCMRIRGLLSEPEFINLLRSPRIDSQPCGPVRKPYLKYRPARLHRLAESIPESIPWNRFLGSLNIHSFGSDAEGQRIMIHVNWLLVVSTENPCLGKTC
jgi:hypothetical protein